LAQRNGLGSGVGEKVWTNRGRAVHGRATAPRGTDGDRWGRRGE
jgi:hypothetical protein